MTRERDTEKKKIENRKSNVKEDHVNDENACLDAHKTPSLLT